MNKTNYKSSKAYVLKDFLNACKYKKNNVIVDSKAVSSALSSPLRLCNYFDIVDFLSKQKESNFVYVNTKVYRKGILDQHPDVDSYIIHLKFWDLYIAFCFINTIKKWYIKSFHSDNSGETISVGNFINLGRM